MRKLLTPKWLAMHALALVLVAAFLLLAYWQVQRGEAGNARSWGYALQWPAFAIFVVYMWIRMAREELHPQPDDPHQPQTVVGAGRPAGTVAAAAEDDEDDPELDAQLEEYNRWLAQLGERAAR